MLDKGEINTLAYNSLKKKGVPYWDKPCPLILEKVQSELQ